MDELIKTIPGAIFYEDSKLYACLASFPVAKGHSIVVWKEDIRDLHLLGKDDYEYLMDKVDVVRNALMEVLGVEKIYLMYMDEVKHVHWHLIPRYNERGFNLLTHEPESLKDFGLVSLLKEKLSGIK